MDSIKIGQRGVDGPDSLSGYAICGTQGPKDADGVSSCLGPVHPNTILSPEFEGSQYALSISEVFVKWYQEYPKQQNELTTSAYKKAKAFLEGGPNGKSLQV
jgi:hypothetical protein